MSLKSNLTKVKRFRSVLPLTSAVTSKLSLQSGEKLNHQRSAETRLPAGVKFPHKFCLKSLEKEGNFAMTDASLVIDIVYRRLIEIQ